MQLELNSRVKAMAIISIAERRLPHDGRIQIKFGGRQFNLRVSSLPTAHGESIVMRLLDQESLRPSLAELGVSGEDEKSFSWLIAAPDGIVLVTVPTGSGKTTTPYACLQHLNQPDRKIITVEDPVEYQLTGVNQVPVRAGIGLTFASALRATISQRHVRRICPQCSRPWTPGSRDLRARGVPFEQFAGADFRRGAGCAERNGTGYRGRMGVFEIFLITEDIRDLIYDNASAARLRAVARRDGIRTMREDKVRKVLAGLTTIDEVLSVTVGDSD